MRSLGGFLFGLWVLFAATLSGLVIGAVGVLPFLVLPRGTREPYAMVSAQQWARLVVWLLWVDVKQDGAWTLPPEQGALIFCNHRSWLDPVLLMARTRSNGVSKSAVFWLPVIGQMAWISGCVFFSRTNKHSRARARKEVIDLVSGPHRLQVFPEGTRVEGSRPKEKVYLMLAMDAWSRGIPVVPCAIYNSSSVLPKRVAGAFAGHTVRLSILPPVWPSEFERSKDFAQHCWSAVLARYDALEVEHARSGN